jgi:hypothetical protein
MSEYWFKQKRYGLGARPSSWQGWALTAIYCATIVGLSAWLTQGAYADEPRLITFAVLTGGATLLFLAVCWRTTEGGWRWRWGNRED